MTRYFYYQVVNIYVTVALQNVHVNDMIVTVLRNPQTFITLLGQTIPAVSLYFCNLVIVKIFTAIPLELLRPWPLFSIIVLSKVLDPQKATRRSLRTGAFFSFPMLYGWVRATY